MRMCKNRPSCTKQSSISGYPHMSVLADLRASCPPLPCVRQHPSLPRCPSCVPTPLCSKPPKVPQSPMPATPHSPPARKPPPGPLSVPPPPPPQPPPNSRISSDGKCHSAVGNPKQVAIKKSLPVQCASVCR